MHEASLTQGTGLHALAAQAMPRMVALASHGDRENELPLLCALCTAWIESGYSVVVLDATVMESDAASGLLQILESARNVQRKNPSESLWPIFPAMSGLEQLCHEGSAGEAMLHLGQLFGGYAILMVYASAQQLATRLPDSGLTPVVILSGQGNAILNTYQSLKQLLIMGRMEPTIVSLTPDSETEPRATEPTPAQRQLQECARDFLGHQITPLRIASGGDDVTRLALRLLESAVKLDTRPASHQITPLAVPAGKQQYARSY